MSWVIGFFVVVLALNVLGAIYLALREWLGCRESHRELALGCDGLAVCPDCGVGMDRLDASRSRCHDCRRIFGLPRG